ncbi:hypothetical protein [Streptomyces sp. MI02-7b]|uniref:hypothetical protein n=1 Tax=Streptomyces sp. MI02-7b TaxID=462941 RepID=UPI0029A875D4|nr:hypothetical protein [Streptomyces sp. MI02-7b]MDX3078626.1 hypothetical protein [Streptomyces sp. MI02-7b]
MNLPASDDRSYPELLNSVAGTASFAAALLVYAGYIYTNAYFGYYHLDTFAIGLDTFELIVRSLRLVTLPALAGLAGALLIPGLLRLVTSLSVSERYRHRAQRTLVTTARAHIVIVSSGVALLLFWRWIQPVNWLPPLLIVVGLLLGRTRAAGSAGGWNGLPWERTLSLLVAGLFMIWSVSLVAGQLGRQDAKHDAAQTVRRVAVVVLSTDRLSIKSPGIQVDDFGPGTHYRYRYRGLRLLIERDHRYYLLSVGWQKPTDPVIVIEDDDSVRIELMPGTQPRET